MGSSDPKNSSTRPLSAEDDEKIIACTGSGSSTRKWSKEQMKVAIKATKTQTRRATIRRQRQRQRQRCSRRHLHHRSVTTQQIVFICIALWGCCSWQLTYSFRPNLFSSSSSSPPATIIPTISRTPTSTSTSTTPPLPRTLTPPASPSPSFSALFMAAKKNKNRRSSGDDMSSWYDSIDDDATPDQVFWQEMERQRLSNQLGEGRISSSGNAYKGGSIYTSSASSFGQDPVAIAQATSSGGTTFSSGIGGSNMMAGGGGGGGGGNNNFGSPVDGADGFGGDAGALSFERPNPTAEQVKAAEATLSEYEMYQVSDNWLDENLKQQMALEMEDDFSFDTGTGTNNLDDDDDDDDEGNDDGDNGFSFVDEETRILQEQLEALPDGIGPNSESIALDTEEDEPWDTWAKEEEYRKTGRDDARASIDMDRRGVRKVRHPPPDSEFYMDYDIAPMDAEEKALDDAEFYKRMEGCQIRSPRLEKAKASSSRSKAFFSRPPDTAEGYDRMWVSAVDNVCFKSLVGNLRNYGVQFADNFGDWQDGRPEDSCAEYYSLEDLASFKARAVYEFTGLPCIASRTCFEIEPVPPPSPDRDMAARVGVAKAALSANKAQQQAAAASSAALSNPKVLSGYKINDVDVHVDYLCDALKPMSDPTRVTCLTSCLCFYDGEIELYEYGVCEVDMYFAESRRTFIPMAAASNALYETLQMTFGLKFQSFLTNQIMDNLSTYSGGGSSSGGADADEGQEDEYGRRRLRPGEASIKLRDRVLMDGIVLPNDIIDVSKFMDSKVDVNLMDECAQELSNRFMEERPTKIVTVATTGLVIALPMAKYLQVPVVYARKERNVVMADTYKASYSSKTVGKNRELLISKSHIDDDDRILVVDDFLSSGASQEALLRIISDAGATAVGVGVLLEKVYESGRQSLSGFNIPIQSLCRVASVKNGVIQLIEEEGFETPVED